MGEFRLVQFEVVEFGGKFDAWLQLIDGDHLDVRLAFQPADEIAARPRSRATDKDSPHIHPTLPSGPCQASLGLCAPTMTAYFGAIE